MYCTKSKIFVCLFPLPFCSSHSSHLEITREKSLVLEIKIGYHEEFTDTVKT